MIPYLDPGSLRIGPIRLQPFGILLVTGVIVGHTLLVRRIRSRHITDPWTAEYFAILTISGALLGAYAEGTLLSHLTRLLPQHGAFTQRLSLSSLGGVMGAMISGFLFARRKKLPLLPLADASAYAFSFAWLFARLGCAFAHDHLGPPSASLLAVQFPSGPRLDLGLLEALGMLPIGALILWINSKKYPPGTIFSALACAYPLLRIPLDIYRDPAADPRYAGFTAAQWQCVLLFIIGLINLLKFKKQGSTASQISNATKAP